MDKFLSCDWGTSAFRLRLVDYKTLQIIAKEKNNIGMAATYKLWQQQDADAVGRQSFYATVIKDGIQKLSDQLNISLAHVPVIISGMVSSTIGMIDLPYKDVPAAVDGSNLIIKQLSIKGLDNELFIISGIKTDNDIMRGEETKAIGCAVSFTDDSERLLIFPGTHPKHVIIKGKKIIRFKTYMTGEIFDLLSTHSILASSVAQNNNFHLSDNQVAFKNGVNDNLSSNVLHAAFAVRTNDILKHTPKENNYHYLSGLLIGTELKDLINFDFPIYLCGDTNLMAYYQLACAALDIKITAEINADEALLKGQKQVISNLL